MAEFKLGRAHGLGDARQKLEPMCLDDSCPYSKSLFMIFSLSMRGKQGQQTVGWC
jgi:hypothetical protein